MKLPKIKGKKIILRPLSIRDAKNFTKWLTDPEVTKFLEMHERPAPTLKEEKNYILKKKKEKDAVQFCIDAIDGEHIGTVALDKIDNYNKRAVFGIFIGNKKYWGQGCGTEAGKLIVDFGFKKLKLHRIHLNVYGFNIRGYKSYIKIGFKKEGVLRQHRYRDGFYHDDIVMGILRSDYLKKNNK